MSLFLLRLMWLPEYVCRCSQRRDWRVFLHLCPVVLQKKAQAQQTREFHKKSIKEKAVHLSSLFTGGGPAELKVTAGCVMAPPAALPSSMLASTLIAHAACVVLALYETSLFISVEMEHIEKLHVQIWILTPLNPNIYSCFLCIL